MLLIYMQAYQIFWPLKRKQRKLVLTGTWKTRLVFPIGILVRALPQYHESPCSLSCCCPRHLPHTNKQLITSAV